MKLSCQEGLVPGARFADKLDALERYGFDAVEVNGAYLNDPAGMAERKAALADSRIVASSICGGYPAELVHPDPRRRQVCADALLRHLEYAAELGAVGPIVVPIFNNNDRIPDLSPWKSRAALEQELLICMLEPLARHAESLGRSILLEPLNRYESNVLPQQVDGARIVRAVGGAGIRLMSDVFHMHIEEPDLPAAIRACSDVIGHVHLADSTRKEPGSGCLDFRSVLRALRDTGYNGFLAFECGLTGPPDEVLPRSVAYLRALIA